MRQYLPIIAGAAMLAGNPYEAEAHPRAGRMINTPITNYRLNIPTGEGNISPRAKLITGGALIFALIFAPLIRNHIKSGRNGSLSDDD